jgi:hypothetical protein
MDVWSLSKNHWNWPLHNTYVPVRHTIMAKPDLNNKKVDEIVYRYNPRDNDREESEIRTNPIAPLNPLKSYKMSDPVKRRLPAMDNIENR